MEVGATVSLLQLLVVAAGAQVADQSSARTVIQDGLQERVLSQIRHSCSADFNG